MTTRKIRIEEIKVNGDKLVGKIKELIHAGNIRRMIIKNAAGKTLIDIPVTISVIGVVLAPQLAVLGAIAAFMTHGSIIVEKVEEADEEATEISIEEMFDA